MKWLEIALTLISLLGFLWITETTSEPGSNRVLGMRSVVLGYLMLQVWSALSAWLDSRRVRVEVEPQAASESWLEIQGQPQFSPEKGVYADILVDGRTHHVVIQPNYWPYLPTVKQEREEASVYSSPMSSIKPGEEPGSLVCIQDQAGHVVGMGARVHCGSDSLLLTSFHVVQNGKLNDLYLAKYSVASKEGLRVPIDREWNVEYVSPTKDADIIAIRVPASVWSRLGVKAAKVGAVKGRLPVVAYGAESTQRVFSSTGFAYAREDSKKFAGSHSCSTKRGWSGTPLYYKDLVVGVHRRWEVIGEENSFTTLSPFHEQNESSEYEGDAWREVEGEEMEARDEVDDIHVYGRGRFKISGAEYAWESADDALALNKRLRESGTSWADMVEAEEDMWDQRLETIQPLNCQEAVSACSPPYSTCLESSTVNPSFCEQTECPSLRSEDRLSNLEKLVEAQFQSSAKMQEQFSLLSQVLIGLKEDLRQRREACSIKQEGSDPSPPPATSSAPAASSSRTTPESASASVSKEAAGIQRKSRGKSKKSRLANRSIETPAPASR